MNKLFTVKGGKFKLSAQGRDLAMGPEIKLPLTAEMPEVGGGQGGHVSPQVLGYQLTLFKPRGADYARILLLAPHLFGRCGVSVK